MCYYDEQTSAIIPYEADVPFYKNQTRYVMQRLGRLDPHDINDALAHGAYSSLAKVISSMSDDEVIAQIQTAGLRGRGGAGFNTARKWRAAKQASADAKFVICNGDEGDPGAFKDRALMEGDPHTIIEGMAIGAFAISASTGYIYVRDEYPLAVNNLTHAINSANEYGLLGENILGSKFSFTLNIVRGAGAFVCGESSALMRSIEGKVGEPRQKYTHATEKGLFDCPTVVKNTHTINPEKCISCGACFSACTRNAIETFAKS